MIYSKWRITYPAASVAGDTQHFRSRADASREFRYWRWLSPTIWVRVDWWQWAPVASYEIVPPSKITRDNWGPRMRLHKGENDDMAHQPRGPYGWWGDASLFVRNSGFRRFILGRWAMAVASVLR